MPISKRIVEMHGGNLKIESRLGQGTVVTLKLPNQRCIDAPASKARAPVAKPEARRSSTLRGPVRQPNRASGLSKPEGI